MGMARLFEAGFTGAQWMTFALFLHSQSWLPWIGQAPWKFAIVWLGFFTAASLIGKRWGSIDA